MNKQKGDLHKSNREVSSNKIASIWGMAKFVPPHYCTLKIFNKRFLKILIKYH